jgi:hypothetical protein
MFNFFKKSKKQPKSQKEILEFLERLDKDVKGLNQDLQDFKKQSRGSLQKVGIKRFNPFKEVGGDQSFSIALLDADNNGLVLTGYYSREMNRVFAKPIENGKSKYPLSEEEIEAIKKANS